MGVMDRFLNAMRLTEDEEGYDDYDDYEETPEEKKASKRTSLAVKEADVEEPPAEKAQKKAPKVTPMRQSPRKVIGNGMEVCVIKPTSVEDAREITETLLANQTVVLNVEGLDVDIAQRIIDFTSGSCFAMNGNLQKISNFIFIITPENVEISGDIQNLVDSFSF